MVLSCILSTRPIRFLTEARSKHTLLLRRKIEIRKEKENTITQNHAHTINIKKKLGASQLSLKEETRLLFTIDMRNYRSRTIKALILPRTSGLIIK